MSFRIQNLAVPFQAILDRALEGLVRCTQKVSPRDTPSREGPACTEQDLQLPRFDGGSGLAKPQCLLSFFLLQPF